MMLRRTAVITAILFGILVTILYWFIPWSNSDEFNKLTSYLTFILTLIGFSAAFFQLRETEIAIRESQEKPQLELEVLTGNTPGNYGSDQTDKIILRKKSDTTSMVGAVIGLRIKNRGTKAASKLWFTFLFKRQGVENEAEAVGKLDVYFIPPEKQYPHEQHAYNSYVEYLDYYDRPDFDGTSRRCQGITFKFSDHLVIHTDYYDRPVVADVMIEMDKKDFEPNFEIHYRIQSYEGNEILETMKKKKIRADQIYPINFILAD